MKRISLCLLIAAALTGLLAPAWGAPAKKVATNSARLMQQGDKFRSQGQLSGALWAYSQAAKAGNVDGALEAGEMLLKQGQASRGRERILQLSEALGDLFFAATNGRAQACADLSDALGNGVGVETNSIAAYAWMELAAERDAAFKPHLDRLVVQLDPNQVRQAQALAGDYRRGRWPTGLVRPVDQGDSRLKIQGFSNDGRGSLVIINNATLATGDTVEVAPAGHPGSHSGKLTITCLKIGGNYVLLSVAGESHLKLLSTAALQ